MKAADVRDLSEKERREKVDDLKREFFNLKFQLATGKIENPGRLRLLRRDIARIKTVQREAQFRGGDNEGEEKKGPENKKEAAKL